MDQGLRHSGFLPQCRCDLHLRDIDGERLYGNLENINTSADHLLSLIDGILDLSRIKPGPSTSIPKTRLWDNSSTATR